MAKNSNLKGFLTKKHEKSGAINILEEIEFIDTGIPSINYVMTGKPKTGGIPLSGKMTTIYGPDGSGKTSLVNHIIGKAQAADVDVVYLDTERSTLAPRLRQCGIDLDNLIYATPEYIEEAFEIIEDICSYRIAQKDGRKTLIVWDSVAGTPAKQTVDRDSEAVEMAADARAITRGLKRIRGKVKNSNVGVLFINQARVNMDPHGDKFLMAGGYGLKHMVDLVIRVNKIKEKNRSYGQVIRFTTPGKNRLFRPFQSTDIFFEFDNLFTRENIIVGFVDFLISIGMIGTSGAWCYSLAEVQDIIDNENLSELEAIKKSKKFYKSAYAEELIANEDEYQRLLTVSEAYIQRNMNSVAEKGKNSEFAGKSEASVNKDLSDEELEELEESKTNLVEEGIPSFDDDE